MSLKFSRGLYGNAPNSIRSACRNSGLPAAPPFEVRFPGSSSAMQAKATTSAAIQAPIVRQGWRLHALARRSVTPASFSRQAVRRNCSSEAPLAVPAGGRAGLARASGLNRSTKLFVERDERKLERVDGVVVRDHVVAVLEHGQEVAGERDVSRQALGEKRVDPHQPDWDVGDRASPDAERGS